MCLACDREQAKIVNNYIDGLIRANPGAGQDGATSASPTSAIELSNNVVVEVHTKVSYRSVRGRPFVALRDLRRSGGFWRERGIAPPPDFEVAGAMRSRSLRAFPALR